MVSEAPPRTWGPVVLSYVFPTVGILITQFFSKARPSSPTLGWRHLFWPCRVRCEPMEQHGREVWGSSGAAVSQ